MKDISVKSKIIIVVVGVLLALAYNAGGKNDTVGHENTAENTAVETKAVFETTLENVTEIFTESTTEPTSSTTETTSEPVIESTTKDTAEKITETVTENITEAPTAAPEKTPVPEQAKQMSCTVSIDCSKIFDNIDAFDPDKIGLLPENGLILPPEKVEITDGDSAFDVLKRVTMAHGIHFEFSQTAAFDSVYIEGINNIYEFDCGELSGWMYRVNGEYTGYGCDRCELNDGDKVEFIYTCDLGRDVGDDYTKRQ